MDCGPARSAARTSFVEGTWVPGTRRASFPANHGSTPLWPPCDAAKPREALNPRLIKDILAVVAKQKRSKRVRDGPQVKGICNPCYGHVHRWRRKCRGTAAGA